MTILQNLISMRTPNLISLRIFLFAFIIPMATHAQEDEKVLTQGKVTYERKVFLQKNLEDMGMGDKDWYERMRDRIPKTVQTNFDLIFNPTSTYFAASSEQDGSAEKVPSWFQGYTANNEVYANFETDQLVIQKSSMGKDFLITDSIPRIDWKITDEFRTIAGFACRKATTILDDSLYVIAFYTDAIFPSSGPEHFFGLPGTALGVAIPRFHTTYLATNVESTEVKEGDIKKPKKGKDTNLAELQQNLYDIGEDFNKGMGQRMSWGIWF